MALTPPGSTMRGGQEQPGTKMRSDTEAASREHQEQLVEPSLQKTLLASPATWDSGCELFPGWALQRMLARPRIMSSPLPWGCPLCRGKGGAWKE